MGCHIKDLARRIQVAPFPHLSALSFGSITFFLFQETVACFSRGATWWGILFCFFTFFCAGIAVFAEADANSRFQEYKRISSLLLKYGWSERMMKPLATSRCQRDAAKVAAKEAGYGAETALFFENLGYRWYHIVPDAVLKNPKYLFSFRFFQASFFAKRYQAASPERIHVDPAGGQTLELLESGETS